MSDWLHNLPVAWMALVIFGFTYLLAATILAVTARGRASSPAGRVRNHPAKAKPAPLA